MNNNSAHSFIFILYNKYTYTYNITFLINFSLINTFLGTIFHKGEEDLQSVFLRAISDTKNENHAFAFELVAVIKYIEDNTDSFTTAVAGKYAVRSIIPSNDYSIMLACIFSNNYKYIFLHNILTLIPRIEI